MPYLSVTEAAEILQVTRRSVYRYLEDGRLTIDDLTADALPSKRGTFKRQRDPHCSTCGTRHNLTTRRGEPAYECKTCAAERMYRARH